MLSTAHVVVGAALGAATGNPVLALIAGVVSHHVMDQVPHWDVGSFYLPGADPEELTGRDLVIATVDGFLSIGLLAILILQFGAGDVWPLLAGGFGGVLPDVWHHIPLWKKWTRRVSQPWFRLHERFHWTVSQPQMVWGLLTQALAIGLGWWWLTIIR